MTMLSTYVTLGRAGLRVSPPALGTVTFDDAGWGSTQDNLIRHLSGAA
jgi:aryl-alcohol dehydrogenase-like predicted oxidoreductase